MTHSMRLRFPTLNQ
ncbi:erythromycin resistance leader peptide [Bacillus sp. GM2]|uniref:Erythromycin resistance leader peptide n=5 Tax=Bacillaceae TaxID=186817 RepID=LPER_BACAN|nr:RecName: Full=Erythromycin resistance leader peptide; AltName: Full=23S rRNA methylase leader peptide [Bacillus anthracis]P62188.1 RecName: Full=Erythromycin resistance leader peptide; AltName: Full=23S rRNA methylase leader peptide [Bacillus licheniformis]AYQ18843.1 hypothetical protein D5285_14565 [Bacillus paralicheniformis]MBC8624482.1 erythromycin resistance leader peptide [Robertmurraya crescens]MBC9088284.1 erythromycin resistance leader peptide [Bacillus sp. Y1]MBD8069783.1 erythrom